MSHLLRPADRAKGHPPVIAVFSEPGDRQEIHATKWRPSSSGAGAQFDKRFRTFPAPDHRIILGIAAGYGAVDWR
jgi:hypothetical protein